jgi:hypothetical protein
MPPGTPSLNFFRRVAGAVPRHCDDSTGRRLYRAICGRLCRPLFRFSLGPVTFLLLFVDAISIFSAPAPTSGKSVFPIFLAPLLIVSMKVLPVLLLPFLQISATPLLLLRRQWFRSHRTIPRAGCEGYPDGRRPSERCP